MLPEAFQSRMCRLLGDEYPAFLDAMTRSEPVRGLRRNPILLDADVDTDAETADGGLFSRPIPYTADGFYSDEEKIGQHPLHHAGGVYSQDPGAMAAIPAAGIGAGWRVLDVCAAPGGKSAQLAAAIGGSGVLVSNEYVPSRAKLLVGNIERLGIPNALVLNTDAATLASWYPEYFDAVAVDAPCSGEGMFRKNEEAIAQWSEEAVAMCAARQREILGEAAKTVRPGGLLIYSTCTFSIEENEGQVADFLASHGDFSLIPVCAALLPYTAPGISLPGSDLPFSYCRRFYPHLSPGEGQFVAVLRRAGDGRGDVGYRDSAALPAKSDLEVLKQFFSDVFGDERLVARVRDLRGNLILAPDIPLPPKSVFAAGVAVGEIRKGILFPHHQLFSALGKSFRRVIDLPLGDPRVALYLHGDVIEAPGIDPGYAAVLVGGCPLGGAKVSGGMAKNLYPKGLRRMG